MLTVQHIYGGRAEGTQQLESLRCESERKLSGRS